MDRKASSNEAPANLTSAVVKKTRALALTKQTLRHTYGSPETSKPLAQPPPPEPTETRKWTTSNRFHYVSGSYLAKPDKNVLRTESDPSAIEGLKSEMVHRNTTGSQPTNFKKL
jgi:hypothetical protein